MESKKVTIEIEKVGDEFAIKVNNPSGNKECEEFLVALKMLTLFNNFMKNSGKEEE